MKNVAQTLLTNKDARTAVAAKKVALAQDSYLPWED